MICIVTLLLHVAAGCAVVHAGSPGERHQTPLLGGLHRPSGSSVAAGVGSPACQKRMDQYCTLKAASAAWSTTAAAAETCAAALHSVGCNTTVLVARLDLLGARQWRCYSPSALDSTLTRYVPNSTGSHCYCTRNSQLAALCSGPRPPAPPPSPPPPGTVAAYVSGKEGYHTYRIPALVRLPEPDGNLLLFAEGRRLSSSDHGWNDIVVKRSSDNGQTWGPMEKVYGESTDNKSVCIGNPAPIGRKDGTVVLVACRDNSDVLVIHSNPLATSWGNATYITPQVKAPAWTWVATGPPQGLELPSGRLLVAADHIGKGGVWGSHAMFSDDGGVSWQISSSSGAAGRPGKNWSGPLTNGNECQVAVAPNHSLIMNMRTKTGVRQFSWSLDGKGEEWTAPTTAPFDFAGKYAGGGTEGSTVRIPNTDTLLFSTPFSQTSRANLTIFSSTNSGATWEFVQQVDAGSSAYSALIDLNATHFGVAWESDDYGTIKFAALLLPATDRGGAAD